MLQFMGSQRVGRDLATEQLQVGRSWNKTGRRARASPRAEAVMARVVVVGIPSPLGTSAEGARDRDQAAWTRPPSPAVCVWRGAGAGGGTRCDSHVCLLGGLMAMPPSSGSLGEVLLSPSLTCGRLSSFCLSACANPSTKTLGSQLFLCPGDYARPLFLSAEVTFSLISSSTAAPQTPTPTEIKTPCCSGAGLRVVNGKWFSGWTLLSVYKDDSNPRW